MKKYILFVAVACLMAACHQSNDAPQLNNRTDTLSWAMGENIALSLQEINTVNLDNDVVLQAIGHTLKGGAQPISDSILREALMYINRQQQLAQMEQARQTKRSVAQQQEEYFKKLTKDNPNVKKHPSGFYYEVLKPGKGANAQIGQRILFDYRSFLMFNEEPYDQTYGVRDPILHVVGRPMFQGLIDALQLMNTGSIYRFYFPYQLAFGETGAGDIPGYTPFIYEVELHEIYEH